MTFQKLEGAWLARKLHDNQEAYGPNLLHAFQASREHNIVLPKAAVNAASPSGNEQASGMDSLRAGGSWSHRWDRSAGCAWNSHLCKI